jgi:phosphoenolpyruvate synthase/pyruvate phosphate dikinase
MNKFVYSFNEGSKDMVDLLGAKGANLAEMTRIGLPVPFGFTVTTEACSDYYRNNRRLSEEIQKQVEDKLEELEHVTGKMFGGKEDPLLVSVRPGPKISMPGIMGTVLNLGLNDQSVEALGKSTGNPYFAVELFCRFIRMYAKLVFKLEDMVFDQVINSYEDTTGYEKNGLAGRNTGLDIDDLNEILTSYKEIVRYGKPGGFPDKPEDQLFGAIEAVFDSWMEGKVFSYRKSAKIPDSLGTAVSVQSMVFGNMGDSSASGVAFTRNPINGERDLFGEFMVNAQGEERDASGKNSKPIVKMSKSFPELYKDFSNVSRVLENNYHDMQEMEFTIEENKLYMLQTRSGNRTGKAAVKIAVDMEKEGLIDRETALMRIDPRDLDRLRDPLLDDKKKAPDFFEDFAAIMSWADGVRKLKIRADADKSDEVADALGFGAEGVGLCRIDRLVKDSNKVQLIWRILLNDRDDSRIEAMNELMKIQKEELKKIYGLVGEKPVTVSLTDFIPYNFFTKTENVKKISESLEADPEEIRGKIESFREENPLMGVRACRLLVLYPEIAQMQTRAIMEAAIEKGEEEDYDIVVEIMVPLISDDVEFAYLKDIISKEAESCKEEYGSNIRYLIGSRIETPRAALIAGKIAEISDFLSFSADKLTQMTFGWSREDTEELAKEYGRRRIFKENIFKSLDASGPGRLIEIATKEARAVNPNLKIGISGDQAWDPESIDFFSEMGLNYISCKASRVPIARIAAAQAVIRRE